MKSVQFGKDKERAPRTANKTLQNCVSILVVFQCFDVMKFHHVSKFTSSSGHVVLFDLLCASVHVQMNEWKVAAFVEVLFVALQLVCHGVLPGSAGFLDYSFPSRTNVYEESFDSLSNSLARSPK